MSTQAATVTLAPIVADEPVVLTKQQSNDARPTVTSPTSEGPVVFATSTYDEPYWDAYLAARPTYDDSLYQSVFAYHETHAGVRWDVAHDVGTGPGQVAAVLAERFKHVVASDNSAEHLAVAQHRLPAQDASLLSRVELVQLPAEDLADRYPAGETDLVAAAECLPLLDAERAVAAWAKLLRPGGTLAAWFYGKPAFADDETEKGLPGRLMTEVINMNFARAIAAAGPAATPVWKRATDRLESWLDDVRLPSDQWTDVSRVKWNADLPLAFYGAPAYTFSVDRNNAVGPHERVEEVRDRTKWGKEWDIAGIRQFVWANLPGISSLSVDPAIEAKYKELEEALGGPEAKHKICWPIVLILASRK